MKDFYSVYEALVRFKIVNVEGFWVFFLTSSNCMQTFATSTLYYILVITVILCLFCFTVTARVVGSVYRVITFFIPKHAQICFKFKRGGTL